MKPCRIAKGDAWKPRHHGRGKRFTYLILDTGGPYVTMRLFENEKSLNYFLHRAVVFWGGCNVVGRGAISWKVSPP